MKTFDYEQASEVLRPLKAKFSDCTHGERDECTMLDKQLECCAKICSALADAVRNWASACFLARSSSIRRSNNCYAPRSVGYMPKRPWYGNLVEKQKCLAGNWMDKSSWGPRYGNSGGF